MENYVLRMRQQLAATLIIQTIAKVPRGMQPDLVNSLERSEELTSIKLPVPSDNLIHHCIIVYYLEKKDFYNSEMSLIPVDKYIP